MYIWKLTYNERSTLWSIRSRRQWVCTRWKIHSRRRFIEGSGSARRSWYVQNFIEGSGSARQWVCPAVGLPARVGMAVGLPAVGPQNWYVQNFKKAVGLPAVGLPAVGLPAVGPQIWYIQNFIKAVCLPAREVMAVGLPAVGPQNFTYNLVFLPLKKEEMRPGG